MNKSATELAVEIFDYFVSYVNHKCVAPNMLGNPTKSDLMIFLGGVTAGIMATNDHYDNVKLREACKLMISMSITKYPSTKKII